MDSPKRTPISGIFTPEEWIACNIIREAHAQNPTDHPEAEGCETMLDSLLYGAAVLSRNGYDFKGFSLDLGDRAPNGRPKLEIHAVSPLGGASNLVGKGPVKMCEVALRFLTMNCPDAADEIDMVQSLLETRRHQWGDRWEELENEAEGAIEQAKQEAGMRSVN